MASSVRDRRRRAMAKRRSAGYNMNTPYRPRSTETIVRTHIGFRPDQIDAINEAVRRAGVTRSAWFRELIDDTFR